MTRLNLRECDMSLFIALNERMDEPDPSRSGGGNEGCSSTAARKPTCLRRPVIRADVEFGNAVPSEAKGKICVNPREFNAIKKEHVARTQVLSLR